MNLLAPWKPAVYHGQGRRPPYFEGWYFKLVNAAGDRRFAIIPGIFKHRRVEDSHAFVQVLDGVTGRSTYHRFPADAFQASGRLFDVRIGPNHFQSDRLSLTLDGEGQRITGDLRFDSVTPWPVGPLSSGVMGWYGFVPLMECYHGVLSFDHAIRGALAVDGERIDFTGGRGYIEKDWGKAFPRGYIWMQTNHFEQPGASLSASVALIPWVRTAFRGFIVGFWHDGTLYRFATYTGADVERLELTDTHVIWALSGETGPRGAKGRYRLAIEAERAEGGLLHAPDRDAMVARVVESLTAAVSVRLARLGPAGEREVFQGVGRHAGLELGGDLSTILDGYAG